MRMNKNPSEILPELLAPLNKGSDLFLLEQLIPGEDGQFIRYKKQNPLLKALILNRLYAYFLYPPSCLCDESGKGCPCDARRQEIYQAQIIEIYKASLEALEKTPEEVEQYVRYFQHALNLTEPEARQRYDLANEQTTALFQEQCRRFTGITDEKDLIALMEQTTPSQGQTWRQQFHACAMNKKSSYRLAFAIGRHLLSQIWEAQHDSLKTHKGRRGFLSLNKISLDIAGKGGQTNRKNTLEFFDGLQPSKRTIEESFNQYRSILHLILGYHAVQMVFQTEDSGVLPLLASHAIQNHLLECSSNTFTPKSKSRLFSSDKMALLPPPSTFISNTRIMEKYTLILTPGGVPLFGLRDHLFPPCNS